MGNVAHYRVIATTYELWYVPRVRRELRRRMGTNLAGPMAALRETHLAGLRAVLRARHCGLWTKRNVREPQVKNVKDHRIPLDEYLPWHFGGDTRRSICDKKHKQENEMGQSCALVSSKEAKFWYILDGNFDGTPEGASDGSFDGTSLPWYWKEGCVKMVATRTHQGQGSSPPKNTYLGCLEGTLEGASALIDCARIKS